MADEETAEEGAPKKKSKRLLIIGLVLALAGGGGGFFAVQSGLLFGSHDQAEAAETPAPQEEGDPLPEVAFVPIDQLIISLGKGSRNKHLLFKSQLEVTKESEAEVEAILPRVVDVMNSYLRAVDVQDLEDPKALIKLRAQMLRRIQTVVGEGRVNDLLIMEFVLN